VRVSKGSILFIKLRIMSNNFYCKIKCGDPDFSIDKWNESFNQLIEMGVEEPEFSKILDGEPCKIQCIDCACTVGERQTETKKLISKLKEGKQ
jgi:hypothetical protein